MARKENKVVSTLNDLVETCKNGEEGFRTASEDIDEPNLKSLFGQLANQRSQFARTLEDEVRRVGGRPHDRGTAAGAAHRVWIDLRSAVQRHDPGAVLSEAERGEDIAKDHYQRALDQDLPDDIRSVVEEQYADVVETHDRVRAMRDQRRRH